MRLIRFGKDGRVRPGLWNNGRIIDLQRLFPDVPDIGEAFFEAGWLERIAEAADLPGEDIDEPLACPVTRPSKIICLGKNYAEHAEEGGFAPPERPLIFAKGPNTLTGPYDPVRIPKSSDQLDWEVELAVIIKTGGKRIAREQALNYIAGFAVMNDVSARRAQFADSQWFRGKSFDTFAPLGPAIVTPDEIADLRNLRLQTRVDGVVMQDGNTRDMMFDIPAIIENISEDITLVAGDIISTGTPAGVGIFRDPPVVLRAGNVVECGIESIGSIINPVVE